MLETIKSYLVSLGFAVNDSEFNKVNSALNDFNKNVVATTSNMIKSFAVAGTEITGSLAAITTATAALVKQTAELDMGYQKFALRMWMTNDSAKDLQVTLKSMGESVEDVAWIPELRQQYYELLNYGNQMKTPGDAGEQLKYIRSIMFEFTRMKLEVSYAAEWISYYLIKYLSDPLAKAKKTLQEFNDAITAKMPEWTNKIAKILSMIVTLTINAGRFIYDVYKGFERFFEMMPRGMKILIGALAGLTLAARMNPILLLLSSALLLIDDFYAYMDGRRSLKSLQPVWGKLLEWSIKFNQKMQDLQPLMQDIWTQMVGQWSDIKDKIKDATSQTGDLWDKLKESQTYKNMIDALSGAWDGLKNSIEGVFNIFSQFGAELRKSMEKRGVLTSFYDMIESISHALDVTTTAIDNLMIKFNLFSKDTVSKNFLTWLADQFAIIAKNVFTFGEVLGHVFSALVKASVGDLKGAAKEMANALEAAKKYNAGGVAGALQDKNKKQNNGNSESSASENESTAWNFFKSKGYSNTQTAGIIGNLITESNINPNSKAADGSGSFGIAQWLGDRLEGLYEFANRNNMDASDINTQLEYMYWELQNTETNANEKLLASSATADAAYAVSKYYERPAWAENPERQNNAGEVYARNYNNTSAGSASDIMGETHPIDMVNTHDFIPDKTNNIMSIFDNFNPIDVKNILGDLLGSFSMPNIQPVATASDGGLVIEGGINISIGGTNATTNDITNAVIQGVQQATGRQISRQTRDLQGAII